MGTVQKFMVILVNLTYWESVLLEIMYKTG